MLRIIVSINFPQHLGATDDIPVRLSMRSGRPLLDNVYLNGHGPYQFLLDTGSETDVRFHKKHCNDAKGPNGAGLSWLAFQCGRFECRSKVGA